MIEDIFNKYAYIRDPRAALMAPPTEESEDPSLESIALSSILGGGGGGGKNLPSQRSRGGGTGSIGSLGGGPLQQRLERRLSNIPAGKFGNNELDDRVAKVLARVTGASRPGMHHDGEMGEKDFNLVSGNEPKRRMNQVFGALYNVFGPQGNDRLTELIFRHRQAFGGGIYRRPESDHFDHLHFGFGS